MTKAVTLRVDASASANSNHVFEVTSASSVSTNGATVSGSFPIQGNTFAFNSTVKAATVELTANGNTTDRKIGETNVTLGEFNLINDDKEVVNVRRIILHQDGDAGDDAIDNLSLDLDGTIVADGVSMVNRTVDFTLDTPFEIKKNENISATVRGDVVGGIDKHVQLYLRNNADADIRGTAYGTNYSANITNTSLDATNADTIDIKGAEINVSFDGPQAAEVKDDSTNVVFANFKINSVGTGINIETLKITMTYGGAFPLSHNYIENPELNDSGNNLAYSPSVTNAASSSTWTFENVNLAGGTQYNFQVRGDIPDNTTTGGTFMVSIDFLGAGNFTARFQDENETAVAPADDMSQTSLTGKVFTVAAPSYSLSPVSTNNNSVVKDAKGVLLYKGKFTASDVDNLRVSKMVFDSNIGYAADGLFSLDYSKLYLYKINSDSTETLLNSITSLGSQDRDLLRLYPGRNQGRI